MKSPGALPGLLFYRYFMECFYGGISANSTTSSAHQFHPVGHKTSAMLSRATLNRIIIIGFMVLPGFCLAKAVYSKSFMGIVLALVSLGAAIYFLYILVKAKEEIETDKTN